MSYLAKVVEVGGTGGKPFEFNRITNGATLKQIWVYVGKFQVRRIKAWLTVGEPEVFGKEDGDVTKFTFEDGEHFTSLSLWKSTDGNRLGAIKFKTNHSREFFAHMQKKDLKNEYPVDVASGICIGIKGRADMKIDSLGFIFLNTIKSIVLTMVEYPTLPKVIPKVNAREIKSMTYQNNTNEPQEYKIETSKKVTQRSSWSVTSSIEFTSSLQVEAGIPRLVESKIGFGLKLGVDGTYSKETTEEKMELFSFPFKVPPGKTVDVDITVGEATFDLPVNGIVKITCHNGGVLEFKTSGTYKGVTYTGGHVVVNESDKILARVS